MNKKDFIGNTALHLAVTEKRDDVIKLLLANGADKEMQNVDGKTAVQGTCLWRLLSSRGEREGAEGVLTRV